MFKKKIIILTIYLLLYQSPLLSKSTSFDDFNSKNLSKYFSGILALENNDNSQALNFLNSSKILIDLHEPYLEKLIMTLVLKTKFLKQSIILKFTMKKIIYNFLKLLFY